MPYLSVVVPTSRVGGLDVLVEGLKKQTFTDFELIIADGVYSYRRDIVAERTRSLPFRVRHVEPFHNPFPVTAFCRYSNTALSYADSAVVLLVSDYTWLPPQSLDIHQRWYRENPDVGLMCPHQYVNLPNLHPSFPTYKNPEIDRYVEDLKLGKLQQVQWSLFAEPFAEPTTDIDPIMGWADPKLRMAAGPIGSTFLHAKHESCGLRYLLDSNGWDEDLDGTNCFQDTEMGERLASRGLSWHLDPTNVAVNVNPRHVFPWPKRWRPVELNQQIYEAKKARGFPTPNDWSLHEKRNSLKVTPS